MAVVELFAEQPSSSASAEPGPAPVSLSGAGPAGLAAAMTLARRFGGTGQISLTRIACRGGVLLAGEAAGFQDALWGFGIRYALLSGHLAARALLSGIDYDRLWKRRFGGLQRASVVNRYFFARMGHPGYRWLMRALRRAPDPRGWLRGFYAPSSWKSLWAPAAARLEGWTR